MSASQAIENIQKWLRARVILQKLNNPTGLILLACVAIVVGLLIAYLGIKLGIVMLAGIIGLPALAACFVNPRFGIGVIIVVCFFVQFIGKHVNAPIGTLLDAMMFVMIFSILVNQIRKRDWSFLRNPVTIPVLIWIFINLIQVANPVAGSKMAWLYTVRSMAGQNLLFFIACYALTSKMAIKTILKVILAMLLLAALYGLKQEFIGFSSTEIAWLMSDPERYQLIVQWGRMRIFSFFSDPTTYGIVMAYGALICISLATGPYRLFIKGVLLVSALLMLMSMAYGGSRTPVVLFPFGIVIFVLLTLRKEYIMAGFMFFILGAGLMMKGTSNAVLFRIQSAFDPDTSGDTMNVRFENQKRIQPFIHTHPFGGGLGSTGLWGRRFTPNSMLAQFPHDSGFVRVAVELGWTGLIVYMWVLFVILTTSVKYYLRVKDPEIKVIYLGITVFFFVLTLASYPQEAIVQLPTSIIFYSLLGIMVRLKDFDPHYQKYYEKKPIKNRYTATEDTELEQNQ